MDSTSEREHRTGRGPGEGAARQGPGSDAQAFFKQAPAQLQPPVDPDSPQARILEAATHSFGERGFDGASTREIASAAEVNQAMIHYYFGSKRALYKRVITAQLHSLFSSFYELLAEPGPFDQALSAFPLRVMSLLREKPAFRRLLLRELSAGAEILRELVDELGEQGPHGFRRALAARYESERREGRMPELPPDHIIQFIISIAYSSAFLEPLFAIVIEDFDRGDDEEWRRRLQSFRTLLRYGLSGEGGKS